MRLFRVLCANFHGLQIKTESGAKGKLKKTGMYNKWKARTHNKVSFKGTGEGNDEEPVGNGLY